MSVKCCVILCSLLAAVSTVASASTGTPEQVRVLCSSSERLTREANCQSWDLYLRHIMPKLDQSERVPRQVISFDNKDYSGTSQDFPVTLPATGCTPCTELVSSNFSLRQPVHVDAPVLDLQTESARFVVLFQHVIPRAAVACLAEESVPLLLQNYVKFNSWESYVCSGGSSIVLFDGHGCSGTVTVFRIVLSSV